MAHLITPRSRVRVDGVASTGQVSSKGLVKHRDHWDGRTDAKALPGHVAYKAKPTWGEVLRLFELEQAHAELKVALMSGSLDQIRRARYRFDKARQQFDQVKLGERTREVIEAHAVSTA